MIEEAIAKKIATDEIEQIVISVILFSMKG